MNTAKFLLITAATPAAALAQPLAIDQHSFPCGGATDISAAPYSLGGAVGQPLAGNVSAPPYSVTIGFWNEGQPGEPPCYPNCDGSTGNPALTANDFQCFINAYAAGASYANCDGSTGNPALTANDFQCFINQYAAGCP